MKLQNSFEYYWSEDNKAAFACKQTRLIWGSILSYRVVASSSRIEHDCKDSIPRVLCFHYGLSSYEMEALLPNGGYHNELRHVVKISP